MRLEFTRTIEQAFQHGNSCPLAVMNESPKFEDLIQKILDHSKYGPAMDEAVAGNVPLVLNYHNHLGESSYCISICAKLQSPPKLLDTDQETLEELVHIEGFGQSEADCLPLTKVFSEALCKHYKIEGPLNIYLNGKRLPSPTHHGEDPGS